MAPVANPTVFYVGPPKAFPEVGETLRFDANQTIDLENVALDGGFLVEAFAVSLDPYLRGPSEKTLPADFNAGLRDSSQVVCKSPERPITLHYSKLESPSLVMVLERLCARSWRASKKARQFTDSTVRLHVPQVHVDALIAFQWET